MTTTAKGFLFTADVSGYTEFLTGSELEHAHGIMRDLMDAISEALTKTAPVEIVKYEGDAVLCYALDEKLRERSFLLEVLESTYVAFADHLFDLARASTCTCRACANSKSLDLKLFLHHGDFIIDENKKGSDISGPNVILLHRMMKNHVVERTGIKAYLLGSDAALARIGKSAAFLPHEESYEHFGSVACCLLDLKKVLEERRATREVRVAPEDAVWINDVVVDAEPATIWDWYFDPARRVVWSPSVADLKNEGPLGIGSAMHCAHGDGSTVIGRTVDWKPFRYFTQSYHVVKGIIPENTLVTFETIPEGNGRTRVKQYVSVKEGKPAWRRWLCYLIANIIRAETDKDLRRMSELIAEERKRQASAPRALEAAEAE